MIYTRKPYATGTYSGNGSSQSISLGWQPAVIFVYSERTTGPATGRGHSLKIDTMPASNFVRTGSTNELLTSNGITITSTGFSVGSEDCINRNAETFHYYAIRRGPKVETYFVLGDDPSPPWEDPPAFVTNHQPHLLFHAFYHSGGSLNDGWVWRGSHSGSLSGFSNGYTTWGSSLITINATGFAQEEDFLDTEYHYFVLYRDGSTNQTVERSNYSGTGSTVTVTIGYQPNFCHQGSSAAFPDTVGTQKHGSMSGNNHGYMKNTCDWETSNVHSFLATGMNFGPAYSLSGETHYWWVTRQ